MEQTAKPAEAPKPKSRTMLLAVIIVVILVVVGVGAYILTRGPSTPANNGTPVSIYDGRNGATCSSAANCGFSPSTLNVKIGTNNTVTWTNNGAIPHTVTSNQTANGSLPSFNSGSGGLSSGQQYTYTFTQAGTYHYYCSFHVWMQAVVIVSS
jgi:plastocyanin